MLDILAKLPRTNCGECSRATCTAFAFDVKAGRASLGDCPHVEGEAGAVAGTPVEEDNYDGVCRALEAEVLGMDRQELARWLGTEDGDVRVPVMAETVRLGEEGLLLEGGGPCHDSWTRMIVYDYLRRRGSRQPTGEWVWPGFFPDTASYVKAFSRNAERNIAGAFGDDLEGLADRCERAGGRRMEAAMGADLTCRFDLLPRVPLYLCYSGPEEGMEASCRLLVDRNADDYLDIEYLAHLVDRFVGRLLER